MLRMMKAELYKLKKSRAFNVLCIIALVMSVFLVVATFFLKDVFKEEFQKLPKAQQEMIMSQIKAPTDGSVAISAQLGYNLNAVQDPFNLSASELFYTSFGSGLLPILMVVLVGALVAKEYASGTIKNSIAYGNKREYYYLSKFIALTVGSIIITMCMVIPSTIGATLIYGWGESFTLTSLFTLIGTFFGFIIVNTSVIAIMMLLASLLKSNGSTIGIGIVLFAIVPTFLSGFYGRFDWYDTLFELLPNYQTAVVQTPHVGAELIGKSMIITCITVAISLGFGSVLFKKQDIK